MDVFPKDQNLSFQPFFYLTFVQSFLLTNVRENGVVCWISWVSSIKSSFLVYVLASALKILLWKHIYFLKNLLWKCFLYLIKKSFSNFQDTELCHIFFRKVFLLFQEKYIQNPVIFRTRSIFRTLVYLESKAYLNIYNVTSNICQTYIIERKKNTFKLFLMFW